MGYSTIKSLFFGHKIKFVVMLLAVWLLPAAVSTSLAEESVGALSGANKQLAEQPKCMANKGGLRAADPLIQEVAKVAPGFDQLACEFAFEKILSRPGLDIKQREIATLAALTALGAEQELKLHVAVALNVGLSKDEIVEVLLQQTVYSGFPRAINALLVAKGVFEERGLQ
jgi:4-carboxymuconolactone decarboxylase